MNGTLRVMARGAALIAVIALAVAPCISGDLGPPTGKTGPRGRTGRRPQQRSQAAAASAQREDSEQGTPTPSRPQPQTGTSVSAPASRPTSANSRLELLSSAGGAKTIAMEFYGLDIDHLLRLLSYAAQVTIVKSDQISGPITVIAPEPVPLDMAFQILDSVLQVRGWTIVRMPTGIYKVMGIAEAAQAGLPVQFGEQLQTMPPGDELITQAIPLRNLSAADVASQLQGMLSQNASIIPTSTNWLIITDTGANIHRALALIQSAEEELSGGLKVFRLQYYDATEMSGLVSSLILARGGGGLGAGPRPAWERRVVGRGGPTVPRPQQRVQQGGPQAVAATSGGPEFAYPDARTNSLIVLATPIHLSQIGELIDQLDRPVSLRDSYFVYPVQNLVASDLADSIAPLIGAQVTRTGPGEGAGGGRGTGGASGRTERQRSGERDAYTRPFGTQGQGTGLRSMSLEGSPRGSLRDRAVAPLEVEPLAAEGSPERSAEGSAIAQAPDAGVPVQQVAPQPERPGGEPPGGEYPPMAYVTGASVAESVIVADDNTNTLLISAPPEQIDLVEQMLEKLDVLPPQVHIRAIIAEVQLGRDTSLGFQWQSLGRTFGQFGGELFTGNVGTGFGLSGPTETTTPTGFFGTLSGSEFDAVLNALTTDRKARILSAPSIFTVSNIQAEINVSQQIPIPTGTFQTTSGTGTISTSIGYRSVGIVLTVTPRVTQGDVVHMDVVVEANEPGSDVIVADLTYPSINQRSAEATVSVRSGETVVLGGLMRDTVSRSAKRIPLLGDLPIIGAFFSQTKSERTKSELVVFLTPQVVRTPAEAAALTEAEKSRLPEVPKILRAPSHRGRIIEETPFEPPATDEPTGQISETAPAEDETPAAAATGTEGAQPAEQEQPAPVTGEQQPAAEQEPAPPPQAPAEGETPAEPGAAPSG